VENPQGEQKNEDCAGQLKEERGENGRSDFGRHRQMDKGFCRSGGALDVGYLVTKGVGGPVRTQTGSTK